MRVLMVLLALVATPLVAGVCQAPAAGPEVVVGAPGGGPNCVQSGAFVTADGLVCAGAVTFGEIHGTVFRDVFGTGVRVPGDGIPNAVLLLSGTGIVPRQTLTVLSGDYAFTGVPAGTYLLCEAHQNNWVLQTVPANGTSCGYRSWGYTVILAPGQIATGLDFGNFF